MAKWDKAPEVTPEQWMEAPEEGREAGLGEALFPRATKAEGLGRKALGGALDAVSGLLRIPAAAGRTLDSRIGFVGAEPQSFTQSLDQINRGLDLSEQPSRITAMTSDASTPVTLAMPVARLVPGAGALAKIGQGMAAGGQIGAGVAAVGQLENVAEGKPLDAKEAGLDVGAGVAAGGVFSALGQGAKALGSKVVEAALKGGHTGRAEGLKVENVFKNKLDGSYAKMTDKAGKALDKLKGEQQAAVNAAATQPIPAQKLFQDVEQGLQAELQAGKHFGDRKVIETTLKDYADDLLALADPKTGEVPLALAHELKKKLQSDASALYKAARAGKDTKAMAAQSVAASLAKRLQEAIEAAAPAVAKPNAKMAETIPIAKALARRNIIAGQNNPIGLDELAAVDAGTQLMISGQMEGGLLPFLVRATKSPYVGSKAYRAGERLQGVGPLRLRDMLTPERRE